MVDNVLPLGYIQSASNGLTLAHLIVKEKLPHGGSVIRCSGNG